MYKIINDLTTLFSSPLPTSLLLLSCWVAIGVSGYGLLQRWHSLLRPLMLMNAGVAFFLAFSAFRDLMRGTEQHFTFQGGLPGLPFHFREDPLTSFFLILLGGAGAGILIFSAGSLESEVPLSRIPGLFLRCSLFLSSMGGLLLADDAYLFLLFWEAMALLSMQLVVTFGERTEVNNAGFLYLLTAHFGTLLILLSFFLLASQEPAGLFPHPSALAFDAMKHGHPSQGIALLVFALGFCGFGAKAGLIPFHAWLPLAHPVAPAPVSALLSGIMLKTAIYGLLRLIFGLLGLSHISAAWGVPVLLLGAGMALFGILYALVQNDPKSFMAYSSIENVGIILLGIGLAILYETSGHPLPGVIALFAALLHSMNHAFFKSLLFLGAGSMIQASGSHDLNEMGGLLRRLPVTGTFILLGVVCASGLPPGNGFLSEWLLLQSSLQAGELSDALQRSAVLLASALLVLASALSAMGFVKFYGIGFLGFPRSENAKSAKEVSWLEQIGMGWLLGGCGALALFPTALLKGLDNGLSPLTGHPPTGLPGSSGWLLTLPLPSHEARYSPVLLLGILFLLLPGFWLLPRLLGRSGIRKAPVWGCGYEIRSARMQDSAGSFGQPIRHFFANFFLMKRHLPGPSEKHPTFELDIEDPHWPFLYRPLLRLFMKLSGWVEGVRSGRISVYLVYSFITLILLLSLLRGQ